MNCIHCNAKRMFLFEGGYCEKHKDLYVPPQAPRKPAGRHPSPRIIEEAMKVRPKKQIVRHTNPARIKYVIKRGREYRQWKRNFEPKWGALSTAKVYSSLARAEVAVRLIGEGEAVKI